MTEKPKEKTTYWGTGSITFGGVLHVVSQEKIDRRCNPMTAFCGTEAPVGHHLFSDNWNFESAKAAWDSIKDLTYACKRCKRQIRG